MIKRGTWWLWALLLSSVVLHRTGQAAMPGDPDLVMVLNRIEDQIERGQLRSSEGQLLDLLNGLGPDAPVSSGYPRLTELLGQVYFKSGQYEKACRWAQQCWQYLAENDDGTGAFIALEQDVLILLAQTHRELRHVAESIPLARQAFRLHSKRQFSTARQELEVLAKIARVLASSHDDATLEQIRVQVERLAGAIASDYSQSRVSFEDYRQSVRTYVETMVEANQLDKAISGLLEYERSAGAAGRIEVWSTVAVLYRKQNQYVLELEALNHAARLAVEHFQVNQRLEDYDPVAAQSLFILADLDRRTAQALEDIGHAPAQLAELEKRRQLVDAVVAQSQGGSPAIRADEQPLFGQQAVRTFAGEVQAQRIVNLRQGREWYEQTLSQIESVAEDERWVTLELAARQALQVVNYYLYLDSDNAMINGPGATVTGEQFMEVSQKLLDRLAEVALPTNRRSYDVRLLMGSICLNEGRIDAARTHLDAVEQYWKGRSRPDYRTLVQTLALLAEVDIQSNQRYQAQTRWKEALKIAETYFVDDGQWTIRLMINLGRSMLAAEQYDEGQRFLEDARSLAADKGDAPSQLRCDVELAKLHARRNDLAALGDTLDAAETVLQQARLPEYDATVLQLRHQQAMLHYRRVENDAAEDNTKDREIARRIWLGVLEVQEKRALPVVEQAVTLHYLARLRFLEWSDAWEQALEQRQRAVAGHTSDYDERRKEHHERCEAYEESWKAYQRRLKEYQAELSGFNRTLDDYRTRGAAYQAVRQRRGQVNDLQVLRKSREKLTSRRKQLLATKKRLDLERVSLRAQRLALMEEFDVKKRSLDESEFRLKDNLRQMLKEAKSHACRALELLPNEVDDAPQLRELIERVRSNYDLIVKKSQELEELSP